jgi:Flp pilus assembly pilin Flp
MRARNIWREVATKFIQCIWDERGTAMTEYLIVSGVAVPLAIYLFHPDNGLYENVRKQYTVTTALLMFPGP